VAHIYIVNTEAKFQFLKSILFQFQ